MKNRRLLRRLAATWFGRTVAVLAGAAWLFAALAAGDAPAATPQPRPNILFIMVDDLGKEWISCYGAEDIETPHVDRLAAGGMRFTNAYSMAQCTPTRATLLTGQYPFHTGWCNHWDVPRWGAGCHFDPTYNVTFARPMKNAGYTTAIAGKWQINDFRVQPDVMQAHGFDECCLWTGYETGNPPSGKRYWDPYVHTNDGSRTYEGAFGPDVFVDFLIDFMRRHQQEPMMLYFPMCLTHTPLVATPAEPDAKGKIARHKAMVRYMDRAVGRLVEALDALEIRDRTIVIFTTDNGSTRGISARRNGRMVHGAKASLVEPGVCQPFVVNCPGTVPSGVVTDAVTDFTDLLPTFVELAGATLPEGVATDGRSIAPLITGRADDSPREWIVSMGFGAARLTPQGVVPRQPFTDRVIRDKRYKLWVLHGKPVRLHDLEVDPTEQHNLIDSDSPEIVAAKARLTAVFEAMPQRDAHPQYDPTPPQPWDRKP